MASLPLRILQVSPTDAAGGAEGSAWNLHRSYTGRGHLSWLAVGEKRGVDPGVLVIPNDRCRNRWARFCLALSRPLDRLRGRVDDVERLRSIFRYLGEPVRWIDKQRGHEDFHYPGTWELLKLPPVSPDIVHCHNLHGGYFDLRALPWLSQQRPVIVNLRDAWLLSGHCAHSFDCQRWQTGCGRCPDLRIYPAVKRDATAYNWQRKRALYAASRLYVTAPSQWLMDKVHASMLQGVQQRVIPNAVDLAVFSAGDRTTARLELALPGEAHIVLLTAHNPFKDFATMAAALGRLAPVGGRELLFVCLGKAGADQALGQGRMIFRGFERAVRRMAQYYRAADVFVHAAKDEAFGKTVTEAMACALPVVATAVGGIPEQIDHGTTGLLVSPKDSPAMAQAVQTLLVDEARRHGLGAAAAVAAQRYGLDRQTDAFLAWYMEIIEDWKAYALPQVG